MLLNGKEVNNLIIGGKVYSSGIPVYKFEYGNKLDNVDWYGMSPDLNGWYMYEESRSDYIETSIYWNGSVPIPAFFVYENEKYALLYSMLNVIEASGKQYFFPGGYWVKWSDITAQLGESKMIGTIPTGGGI